MVHKKIIFICKYKTTYKISHVLPTFFYNSTFDLFNLPLINVKYFFSYNIKNYKDKYVRKIQCDKYITLIKFIVMSTNHISINENL
jgi:hypothetical protein